MLSMALTISEGPLEEQNAEKEVNKYTMSTSKPNMEEKFLLSKKVEFTASCKSTI